MTTQSNHAVRAARSRRSWGRFAARRYCERRSVHPSLYALACRLEAEDRAQEDERMNDLESGISERVRDSQGNTKLPGSIVAGFTPAESRYAVREGWIRWVGDRTVLTPKGYQEL